MISIKRFLREYTTPLGSKSRDGLPYWQEKILLYLMLIFMIFVPISYIPSVILAIKVELWTIVIIDTVGYGFLIYLFLNKRLSVIFRVSSILLISYLIGVVLLLIVGPFGAGYLWLFFVPILASIFLSARVSLIAVFINLLTLIGLGIAYSNGYANEIALTEFNLQSWFVISANFIFLDLITTVAIVFVINGLEKTLKNELVISESLIKKSRELKIAKDAAEKSELMKSNFLAQMSHEIRSPISTVMSFISLVKDKMDLTEDEETAEYFNTIRSGSDRIIRTIDMILSMSEIQSGSYAAEIEKVCLLDDVIQPLIKEFSQVSADKNLQIKVTNLVNNDGIVQADIYSLTQIFANLIDNAVKYTEKGSIFIVLSEQGESLKVEIVDTGIGMSSEYINELFNPFSQEYGGYSRRFKGVGLGLALVKKYCELNDADISVESEKDKGTKFTVILPAK